MKDSFVSVRPPVLDVSDAEVQDLRSRLLQTRWPTAWPDSPAEAGIKAGVLSGLVARWATDGDWRTHEARINALPWHTACVSGTEVCYLRYDGETPRALPLVLTHGWPSSVLELTALVERLAAPSGHRGDAADAFTVLVPALPGFVFSRQRPTLPPDLPIHELWHWLMHDELGVIRYGAHGGDLGAGVTSLLAQSHPEALVGIHLLAVAAPSQLDVESVTVEEQSYLGAVEAWTAQEGGYQHQQATRPATLASGLSDSPVGLLAWIVEKYRACSDCNGELSRPFTEDFVLTQASLYWFTNTISTAFRPYYEHAHGMRDRVRAVDTPTALAVFPRDHTQPPRSWAERTYNLTRYTQMPRGVNFAAHEEPELLASDLQEFFADLR